MQDIKEIDIDNEKIFLKKSSFFGWGVVNPIRKNIFLPIYDKVNKKFNWDNINWFNLITGGSWLKIASLIFFILIALGLINEYTSAVKIANQCLNSSLGGLSIPYFAP